MRADSGSPMMDMAPAIRVTDKATGVSRDLAQLMGMNDMSMAPTDFHFGQNVFLPDGTYQVTVMLGPSESAQFRDVVVVGSSMMDGGMNHDMGPMPDAPMTNDSGG